MHTPTRETKRHHIGLTVSSVMMAWTCVQNMMQVKSEKRNPSNTAKTMEMKTNGAGKMASQPTTKRTRSQKKLHLFVFTHAQSEHRLGQGLTQISLEN